MKVLRNISILILLISFIHGCGNKSDETVNRDDIGIESSNFNYQTSQAVSKSILITWNDEPLPNTVVKFYLKEIGDKGVFIG